MLISILLNRRLNLEGLYAERMEYVVFAVLSRRHKVRDSSQFCSSDKTL